MPLAYRLLRIIKQQLWYVNWNQDIGFIRERKTLKQANEEILELFHLLQPLKNMKEKSNILNIIDHILPHMPPEQP